MLIFAYETGLGGVGGILSNHIISCHVLFQLGLAWWCFGRGYTIPSLGLYSELAWVVIHLGIEGKLTNGWMTGKIEQDRTSGKTSVQ